MQNNIFKIYYFKKFRIKYYIYGIRKTVFNAYKFCMKKNNNKKRILSKPQKAILPIILLNVLDFGK